MSEDRRFKDLAKCLRAFFYSPVRISEIVNYDFHVVFWDFAFKDNTCLVNFLPSKGFVFPYF